MKKISTILSLALLLFACNRSKTGPTTVSGTLKDAVSGQVMPNEKIFLTRSVFSINIDNGHTSLLDTTRTNAPGQFSFSFEAEKGYKYYVSTVFETQKQDSRYCGATEYVRGGSKNTILLNNNRMGVLRLEVKNIAPLAVADTFYVSPFGGTRLGYMLTDTVAYLPWCSTGQGRIDFRIFSGGVRTEGSRYYNVGAWDTTTMVIEY